MEDLQIDVPDNDDEPESLFGIVILRICLTFLCALVGFILVILGHTFALTFIKESEEFNKHTSLYFSISIGLWVLIGLITPFNIIKEFFEGIKDVTHTTGGIQVVRIIIYCLILGAFIVIYRYLLTYAIAAVVALLGLG